MERKLWPEATRSEAMEEITQPFRIVCTRRESQELAEQRQNKSAAIDENSFGLERRSVCGNGQFRLGTRG